jgi:signal transduction histidine kinase
MQRPGDDRWSEDMFRIVGRDPDAGALSLEEFISTLVHPEDRERVRNAINEAIRVVAPFEAEYRLVMPDGSTRTVRSIGEPFRDREGTIVSYVGALTELSGERSYMWEVPVTGATMQQRIRQHLHDGLGSHLTGTAMLARALARIMKEGGEVRAEDLEEVAELVSQAADEARQMANGVIPALPGAQELGHSLRELAASTERRAGIHCTITCHPELDHLTGEIPTQLYWIAREAVNNAMKHARATHIDLRVSIERGEIVLLVRDNGRGMSEGMGISKGMGLEGMRQRARSIGATIAIGSGIQGGTAVRCGLREIAIAECSEELREVAS